MNPTVGFPLFLLVTLAFLGGVVFTGRRAQRKRHIPLVASAIASLAVTIYFAEKLGTLYDLEAAGFIYPFHLAVAKLTVAAYLLPLITGPLTIRHGAGTRWLRWHRRVAYLVLAATLLTALSGALMLWMAERLQPI